MLLLNFTEVRNAETARKSSQALIQSKTDCQTEGSEIVDGHIYQPNDMYSSDEPKWSNDLSSSGGR